MYGIKQTFFYVLLLLLSRNGYTLLLETTEEEEIQEVIASLRYVLLKDISVDAAVAAV